MILPQITLPSTAVTRPFTFYEFFAGGGMARLGLGERDTHQDEKKLT